MKLTVMETKLINAMRQNEYEDALDSGMTWTFTAIDNSGIGKNKASGVVSSLVQKGLIYTTPYESQDEPGTIGFTEAGKKLFDNADGEECSWGGPRLLKEVEIDVPEFEASGKPEGEAKTEVPAELQGKTKSETIRNLIKAGWKRTEIAKALNIRYQHVRQVEIAMNNKAE